MAAALPAGWRWTRLGEVCEFVRGVSFARGTESATARSGYLPILRAGNIRDTLDTTHDLLWVPAEHVSGEQRIRGGDIAICMSSGSASVVGKTAQATSSIEGSVGSFCGILRARERAHAPYLGFWLRSEGYARWRDTQARGANIQNLRFTQLQALMVPLPPLPEQRRIAAALREQLGVADRARAAAGAQLKAARALPAAYLREVFESEEAGAWPRKRLAELCRIAARQVDPTNGEFACMPHVSAEDIESGLCRLGPLRTAAEDGMTSPKYLFAAGEVLYSKLRPYLRKVAVPDFPGVCSADMYPISVDPEALDASYLAWVLLSDEFTRYADGESRRARMPKLNREQLLSWTAPLPPIAVQRRVAARLGERVDAALRLRDLAHAQLETVHGLPPAFLRRAFRGEL